MALKKNSIITLIKTNYLLIIVIIISSFIYCTNLGGRYYTNDEPETVLFGKTILKFGLPLAWDGKSLHSGSQGLDFHIINGYYLWNYHPWLQFYLAALGLLFGTSPAVVRLPFALFGVATIVVTYFLSMELFKSRFVSFLVSLQLIFLIPFFLYMRQVRYYSPDVFFYLVVLWLMIRLHNKKWKTKEYFFFALGGFFLFLTNYVTWVAVILFITIFILWKRCLDKKLIGIIFFQILFAGIWYLVLQPYHGHITLAQGGNNYLIHTIHYLSYVNSFLFSFLFLPLVFIIAKKHSSFWLLSLWISSYLLIIIIFLDPHGRYLVNITPVLMLFYGYIYTFLLSIKHNGTLQRLAYAGLFVVFLITLTSNILGQLPWILTKSSHVRLHPFPEEFYYELTGYYPSMQQQLGKFLLNNYSPNNLSWSNGYDDDIYNLTGIPRISPICDTNSKKYIGPNSVTNPDNIKLFIFYHDFNKIQSLSEDPCLGPKWQKILNKNYKKLQFSLKNVYMPNDTDIVSHDFPPFKADPDEITIYEKK